MANKVVVILENGEFLKQVPYKWEPNGEIRTTFVPTQDINKAFDFKGKQHVETLRKQLEKFENSKWDYVDTEKEDFIYD
ncbi:hypothetical protein [Mammaliicoccus phage vB_MscM-PMS3]|nr:hypothetical protein [Mammaliicoccus phage vB_MscM-PMS3]